MGHRQVWSSGQTSGFCAECGQRGFSLFELGTPHLRPSVWPDSSFQQCLGDASHPSLGIGKSLQKWLLLTQAVMGEGFSHKCLYWLRSIKASIRYGNGRG